MDLRRRRSQRSEGDGTMKSCMVSIPPPKERKHLEDLDVREKTIL